jgi:SAM-dependent methyltransferase
MTVKEVVGAEYIPNDDCPVCYANHRSRLLYAFLTRRGGLEARKAVLHVAPELTLFRHVFSRPGVDYHPADLTPEEYPEIPGVERVDVTAIPYPDRTFDLILCNHVLEHVPDDRQAMRELRRVLKDDGVALLQVPLSLALDQTDEDLSITDPAERERRFGQFDHLRLYAVSDYVARLVDAGFEVELAAPEEIAGPGGVERLQLNPRERLVIGRRGATSERAQVFSRQPVWNRRKQTAAKSRVSAPT